MQKNLFFEVIKAGDLEGVSQLLEANPALAHAHTESNVSAIMLGLYYHKPEIVSVLLSYNPPLDIFEAAATGNIVLVEKLLQDSPDLLNSFACDGLTPLGLAAFFGHLPVVQILLKAKADVNLAANNMQCVTPLHSAVAAGHVEIARTLLEHGAQINALQEGGFTPLHAAAFEGQTEMLKLLLEFQADPTLRAENDLTALDLARENGYYEVADLLALQR